MLWYIFVKIVFMSLSCIPAGIAVWIISKIFSGIFTKKAIYYLWLVPMIIAVIPCSIPKFTAQNNMGFVSTKNNNLFETEKNNVINDEILNTYTNNNGTEINYEVQNVKNNAKSYNTDNIKKIPVKNVFAFAYLIIFLTYAVLYFARAVNFKYRLRKTTKKCDYVYVDECKNKTYFKKNVSVYTLNEKVSPFAYGIFNMCIVIPYNNIEKEAFMHELVHVKRKDMLYMFFTDFVKMLHFFNPFVYFFTKQIKKYMELSCDEYVAGIIDDGEKIAYGKSIIKHCAPISGGAACLSENGKNIKERLAEIMQEKTYSKKAKITSLFVVFVIIITQTALAAAINAKAPVKSYAVNNADFIYSVVYRDGNDGYWSKTSGIDVNRAAIVNTPFYKGFSADLKLKFHYDFNEGKADNINNIDADMHIEMDKLIKTVENGKHWQGLFTVTVNGEIIMYKAIGYLNYIPGDYSRNYSRLLIDDGTRNIDVERIDFDLRSDDVINNEYDEYNSFYFEPETELTLKNNFNCTWIRNGKKITDSRVSDGFTVNFNSKQGKLWFEEIPFAGGYYITPYPNEKYTFKDNAIYGKFLLKYTGNVVADEFDGVLDGIKGAKFKLISNDKTIKITADIAKGASNSRNTFEYYGKTTGLRNGFEDGSDFSETCENYMIPRRLNDLPFTLTYEANKNKVILKLKDGFKPLGWFCTYSSYTGSDSDVYNQYNYKESKTEYELDICDVKLASHNLQFNYYTASPYVKYCSNDIMFKIVNGKIVYSSCNDYITENKNYTNKDGEKELYKYMLAGYRLKFDR